ncbi:MULTISPECIES: hypothetical protein [Rhodococcus]|uniref:hypothetical protein n=1 Tax=Rhodococcus TaxID=1827 RepID=UPI00193C5D78|nr:MULTISPECIES: hypothetical protein [Rhodococcus]QRI79318.1 hypothetical protein JQ505_28345 [Rhodococcus aetherivorans]QSE62528.1 hypothetical protein JYA75_28140 [Rhodococcus sp. PSBB066]
MTTATPLWVSYKDTGSGVGLAKLLSSGQDIDVDALARRPAQLAEMAREALAGRS